ncbi:hypothetical protein QJS83_12140 [Bdellovibrio sp. 22V]|uniref:hypothetical protein n=1 Tax=Bdellovibrio TaxID=958 RepID=UPI002543087E|nr:hypothetical protein [Bdellovibrio sp. 22V]WII71210.1 hypothetical protein QJS83_12140 [Bdellovibrio sp. 22V]
MKKFFIFLSFAVTHFLATSSLAGTLVEVGGTYLSDNLTTSSTTTSTKYFYNVGILFNFKKTIWGGWNYSGISHTDKVTETTTFTSQDTGPYMKWQFGKNEFYSLSAAYNILSRGTFSDGTTSESWQGTSFWIQFGLMPELKPGLHVGASINYYLANYTKKTVSGVESSASNSKSWIFPMLGFTKQW